MKAFSQPSASPSMGARRRMWGRDDLLAELKGLGLLRDRALERSFLRVRQEDFLPDVFGPLAYSDMPLPIHATPSPPTMPSPRCLIAALDLLEPAPGQRILIAGCRGGYVAGLLAEIVGAEMIVVAESDPVRLSRAADRLQDAGLDRVRVVSTPPEERFDRILVLDATAPRQLVPRLADPGFLIARGRGVHDLAFLKLVHNAGETMQMTFNEAPSAVIAGGRDAEPMSAVDFGRLFAVEDLLVHAWEGRVTGHYDQHFRDIADETFAGGPLDLSAFDAREEPCKLAIKVDAAFGNPYNDIGAYLIEIGRLDDAIPWLERATAAPRYCCYFYAHTNLARIYLQKGMREKARKCLLEALRVNPEYEPARELLRRIDGHGGYHA